MKIKVKDLILINELVQVSTNTLDNKIKQYIIEVNKKEKALIVEAFQEHGNYSVFLRKELEDVEEDEKINIANSEILSDILKNIIDDDEINITMSKKGISIDSDEILLATYEPDEDEIKSRNLLLKFFNNRNYGETDNILNIYKEDKDNPKYDAKCRLDLSKLKANKIRNIFSDGNINIKVQKGVFYFNIKGINSINRKIKSKGKTDETKITGDCDIMISDLGCFNMLSKFKGFVNIEMKKEFPLLIKKKLDDEKIGINYVITIATKND